MSKKSLRLYSYRLFGYTDKGIKKGTAESI